MVKFFDENFDVFDENLVRAENKKFKRKDLLNKKYNIVVLKDSKIVKESENVQPIYLYPMCLLDYIHAIKSTNKKLINPISLFVLEYDKNLNYENFLSKFENLKSIELLITKNFRNFHIKKVFEIMEYCQKRGIKISLKIDDIVNISDDVIEKFNQLDIELFRIILKNISDEDNYNKFLNKLSLIKGGVKLVKSFLNLSEVCLYEKVVNDLNEENISIFQVSKELLPIKQKNKRIDNSVEIALRHLESKYKKTTKTRFVTVKNLSTLYYDRFTLNENNSRHCYAAQLKPVLFKDKVLPCKVNCVLKNKEFWDLNEIEQTNDQNSFLKKYGINCSDCASIFENDSLNEFEKFCDEKFDIKFKVLDD